MAEIERRGMSPEMRQAVAEAEAIHAGVMLYMDRVVLPFAESMHRAIVSDVTRLARAFEQAEQRRPARRE